MRPARHRLGLFLCGLAGFVLAGAIPDRVGAEEPKYAAIGQLPAADRARFEAGYKAYKVAQQAFAESQRQSAQSQPLYDYARSKLDELQRVGDGFNEARRVTLDHFRQQGDETFALFKQWSALSETVVAYEVCAELMTDVRNRSILAEAAMTAFEAEGLTSGKWANLQDRLPADGKLPTRDQAAELWTEWLRRNAEPNRAKIENLEGRLKMTESQRASGLLWIRSQAERPYFELYTSRHVPNSETDSEQKLASIAAELSGIWPGWQKIYREAEYTPFPTPAAPPTPAPAAAFNGRQLLMAINIGVVGLVCGALIARQFLRPRDAGNSTPPSR